MWYSSSVFWPRRRASLSSVVGRLPRQLEPPAATSPQRGAPASPTRVTPVSWLDDSASGKDLDRSGEGARAGAPAGGRRAGRRCGRPPLLARRRDGRLVNNVRYGRLMQVRPAWDSETRRLRLDFPDGSTVDGVVELGEAVDVALYGEPHPSRSVIGPWQERALGLRGRRAAAPLRDGAVDRGARGGGVTVVSRGSLERLALSLRPAGPSTAAGSACCSRSTACPPTPRTTGSALASAWGRPRSTSAATSAAAWSRRATPTAGRATSTRSPRSRSTAARAASSRSPSASTVRSQAGPGARGRSRHKPSSSPVEPIGVSSVATGGSSQRSPIPLGSARTRRVPGAGRVPVLDATA